MLSPIILFVYKRPYHTKETLETLKRNNLAKESELFIFSEAPVGKKEEKDVLAVRQLIRRTSGFKKIIIKEKDIHYGLAKSIIAGVTEVISKTGKVIVLEDDLVSSPVFLKFMNRVLEFYEKETRIFSVTGFNYPIDIPNSYPYSVYPAYRATSWGWGTWKDRWVKADWTVSDYLKFKNDEEAQRKFNRGGEDLSNMLDYQMRGFIDSWAIRWCYTHFKNKAYCLHPTVSKLKNIGLEGSGTHRTRRKIDTKLDESRAEFRLKHAIQLNKEIQANFSLYFRNSFQTKILNFVKRTAWKTLNFTKIKSQ